MMFQIETRPTSRSDDEYGLATTPRTKPTTVRQISPTTIADIYDKTDRRGDRNGFEWILSPGVLTGLLICFFF